MSQTNPEAVETSAETDTPDATDAEHTIKATKDIAGEIHDACGELEIGEDVWSSIDVNEPKNPASMVSFTLEGAGGLYYFIQVVPKTE